MSSNIQRRAGSIVEVLRHRAHHQGEQLAYTFLRDGEALEEPMSYGSLDRGARTLAASLLDRARPGEPVLIVLQPGLGYIAALFACFYARLVAVPSFPPRARRLAGTLSAIGRDCNPAVILTDASSEPGVAAQLHRRHARSGAATRRRRRYLDLRRLAWTAPRPIPRISRCCNTHRVRPETPKASW